jgi:hypothetical protein
MIGRNGVRHGHVQAVRYCFQYCRHGVRSERLHQMRSDLGRLDAAAEVLQIGPLLGGRRPAANAAAAPLHAIVAMAVSFAHAWRRYCRGGIRLPDDAYSDRKTRSHPRGMSRTGVRADRELSMKFFRAAALLALLTGPTYAQSLPDINIIPEARSKTPDEIEQDKVNEQAYKESLRKIPDAKVSSDPWGNVRGTDAPKAEKSTQAKPRTKTGSAATKTSGTAN